MAYAKALRQDLGVLGTVKKPASLEPSEGETQRQRAGEVGRGVGEEPCYGTVWPRLAPALFLHPLSGRKGQTLTSPCSKTRWAVADSSGH